MVSVKTLAGSLAPLLMAFATGCAPAYHAYSGCYVDCQYCAPPPLPYAHYEGCVCHACAVSNYLAMQLPPTDQDSAGGSGSARIIASTADGALRSEPPQVAW